MTGSEIRALAESYVDDTIPDEDALLWINEYLTEPELIEAFRKTEEQSLTVADSDTWYDRTSGHLSVVYIADSSGYEYKTPIEFNHDRTKLRGMTADTYIITSLILPTAMTALTETPDVHELFHRPLAAYMASKFKLAEYPEDKDGLRLMREAIEENKRIGRILLVPDKRPRGQRKKGTWQ